MGSGMPHEGRSRGGVFGPTEGYGRGACGLVGGHGRSRCVELYLVLYQGFLASHVPSAERPVPPMVGRDVPMVPLRRVMLGWVM